MKHLCKKSIFFVFISVIALLFLSSCEISSQNSLVPLTPSGAPDYFCTWNVQGYVVNYSTNALTREAINEKNIFGTGKYENWIDFFPSIRSDLYFVMDDSWDIPQDVNTTDNEYLGTAELDTTRFPSFTGSPCQRLKQLAESIKSHGWKGAGGWICAQEALKYGAVDPQSYWTERLKTAQEAGFVYWKVDWGKQCRQGEWRRMLTTLGHEYAPDLVIEHAFQKSFIEFSDVFRTYDVENIIAQPVTIERVAGLLPYNVQGDAKGIINCEDEPYIAAGLGCAIGVMRHPFNGTLPDGAQDYAFPPVGRDIKNRMDEVIRGVRWHRIAEPFGVGSAYEIDSVKLTDYWILGERETWVRRKIGDKLSATSPARVSRGLPLPEISNLYGNDQPFVLASAYPNGAVAIATIGRSLGRNYVLKQETVTVTLPDINAPVGIFGDYKELILVFPGKIGRKITVYGQDLAGEIPVNITGRVKTDGNRLIVPGDVIRKIGLMAATPGDLSDPGMVLKVITGSN
ncbi:hypothetical protein EZS27_009256 [termite gut metagenome]|uniref:Uncharacterized protein n=1 Tax=termite gut metagenome TaxID=433724 RepID=A0A5J4SAZ6_9ZZZZ